MRKWLVETTGEVRAPVEGEYYLGQYTDGTEPIILSQGLNPLDRYILRVTEITEKETKCEKESG